MNKGISTKLKFYSMYTGALMLPACVFAAGTTGDTTTGPDSSLSNKLYDIAESILGQAQSILLPILLPILAVMIIFYGFKILTTSDAKSVEEAKRNAIHCIIGPIKALIVLAIAVAIFGLICSIIFHWRMY